MTLKYLYAVINYFFYCVSGLSIIEISSVVLLGHAQNYFPNVSDDIKTALAVVALFIGIAKLYVFITKSVLDRAMQRQEIISITQENEKQRLDNNRQEIDNNRKDLQNYLFRHQIDGLGKDEIQESKNRLKD